MITTHQIQHRTVLKIICRIHQRIQAKIHQKIQNRIVLVIQSTIAHVMQNKTVQRIVTIAKTHQTTQVRIALDRQKI